MTPSTVACHRHAFGDGVGTVVTIRATTLDARRITMPSRQRAREVAHVLSALTGRSAATLALPAATIRSARAPSALQRRGDDHFPTLRAAIAAWLHRGGAAAAAPDHHADVEAFLARLRRRGLVAVAERRVAGVPATRVVPVAGVGALRAFGAQRHGALAFNTHFFVFDPREVDAPTAAIGDPVGMLAYGGRIVQPPTLPRATLLQVADRWQVGWCSAADLEITLPDGTTVHPGRPGGPLVRYRGDGAPAVPPAGVLEVCLQGESVSVVRDGAGLHVPHGGIVLTFTADPGRRLRDALLRTPVVRYRAPRFAAVRTALQAGPLLVRDGAVVVDAASFANERFHTLGAADPTAPLVFPADHDRTRAARVGVGVTGAGELVVVAVEGTSSLSQRTTSSAPGCTLTELATLLLEAGAVDALNLDGGGSAQAFRGNGAILASTDARGVDGARFDRPVPVAAFIDASPAPLA